MMKKLIVALLLVLSLAMLAGCGKTRIVHCDRCGKEITVPENSNVTEEWILFCEDCEKEVGPVVDPRP
jgi:DNA replicative helicase MCM subunit Mcm2 (Cdc46/Mcm family)